MKYTWLEVLQDKWWIGVLAFAVSLVVTPIVRHIAYRTKAVDRPDDLLKPHGRPVAYLGGVAMWAGLMAGLIAYMVVMPGRAGCFEAIREDILHWRVARCLANPLWNLLAIAVASTIITFVGLLDDIRDIGPRQKLLGQVLAAGVLLVGGVGDRMASVVFSTLHIPMPPWLLTLLSGAMCVLLVIAACNATNLLDGLDGLCGGVTGIIALGFLALAIWLAVWGRFPGMDELRVALCLAMAGAVLGFLPYNTAPASIFMGDAGSMLLGFFVAIVMALFCQEANARWFLAACMVFALPILDTALAVVRRLLSRKSIFAGDRSHLYDQLVDRGMSVKQVVVLFYVLAVAAAAIGVLSAVFLRGRHALVLYSLLFVAVWVLFAICGLVLPSADQQRAKAAATAAPGRLSVLFTSVGRRVSLLKEFRRAAIDLGVDLEIHAADCDPLAPGLQVADRRVILPPISRGQYCDSLLDYCRRHRVGALIPLIDTELLPLAECRERFAEAGTKAIISAPTMIRKCMDKLAFSKLLLEHGFRTPRILADEELTEATFPLFLKPRHGSSSLGARKIRRPEELAYFRHMTSDAVVQEFIDGVEYTVDVFVDFGGAVRCTVPRRRHEVRAGEVSKSQTVMNRRIMKDSRLLLEAIGGGIGPITIQCFLTDRDEIVFIEINPRFGGGVPLSIRAGADSPRWLLEELVGREPSASMDGWKDGLYMLRYDEGVFASTGDLPEA